MLTKDNPVYTFSSKPVGGKWIVVGKVKGPHTFMDPKNTIRNLKVKYPSNKTAFEIICNHESRALFKFKKA